jgi:hypothetical protein
MISLPFTLYTPLFTHSTDEGDMITVASSALPLDNIKAKGELTGDQLNIVNAVRDRVGDEDEDDEDLEVCQ